MLEAERSKKDDKNHFKSINQKYVPTSLNEIQAGFDLDIAKQSKVSLETCSAITHELVKELVESKAKKIVSNSF